MEQVMRARARWRKHNRKGEMEQMDAQTGHCYLHPQLPPAADGGLGAYDRVPILYPRRMHKSAVVCV